MYILLTNNIVTEIIPNENPVFPGIPIDKRYSAEFLAECIALDDATGIRTGMLYDADTQTFSEPAPLEPEPAEPSEPAEPEPGELEILQAENKTLKAQVNALSEQQAFYEDCIAEMAGVVYA